jgi:hypothetical protein
MSEVDDLYGLAGDEFVPRRDALAKRLRADGRGEEASAVAALRKPSVAAWAANQAIRSQPRAARELWSAGDELMTAHEAIIAGKKSGDALRAATTRHRAALRVLLTAAAGLLDHRGRSPTPQTLQLVESTLHAASLDPGLRPEATAGRLTTDHRHTALT